MSKHGRWSVCVSEWRVEMPTRIRMPYYARLSWLKLKRFSRNNSKKRRSTKIKTKPQLTTKIRRLSVVSRKLDWCKSCARSSATHDRFTSNATFRTSRSSTCSWVAALLLTGRVARVLLTKSLRCLICHSIQQNSRNTLTKRKKSPTRLCWSILKMPTETMSRFD